MNIITNINNIVVLKADSIEYGIYDEPFEKYKIIDGGITYYFIENNCVVHDIDELPRDYKDMKYCYTETDGFYLNPNFVEPIDYETETRRLIEENEELKTTVSNLENNAIDSELEIDFRLSMLELGLA